MGRAHLFRPLEFERVNINTDDYRRITEPRPLDRTQADRAAANDHHARPRLDAGSMNGTAIAGHHRTAQECGSIQREIFAHRHRRLLRDDVVFGVRRDQAIVVDRRAVAIHASRPIKKHPGGIGLARFFTKDRLPLVAIETVAAVGTPRADYMIARLDAGDARPHGIDHAGALMADNRRQVDRLVAVHRLPVGMTETTGGKFHPHFARAGVANLDFFDTQFARRGIEDGCFHLHG